MALANEDEVRRGKFELFEGWKLSPLHWSNLGEGKFQFPIPFEDRFADVREYKNRGRRNLENKG